ncbi:hypothetical protein K0H02_05540 [Bacteroides fragilis]|nr:hypothetical protein [Bacteroides fragilis]
MYMDVKQDPVIGLKKEILELTDIIVAASVRALAPAKDEMPMRQAWEEFGRTWLEYHVSRKHIAGHRAGPHKNSPIMFSRTELLALKEAERRGARMVRK